MRARAACSSPLPRSGALPHSLAEGFGAVREETAQGRISRAQAIAVMRAAAHAQYPACRYAFAHGSATSGTMGPYSDLDVVVIVERGGFWERKCVNFDGYLVEFQAFALDSMRQVARMAMLARSNFGLVPADATILIDADGAAATFRAALADLREQGPRLAPRAIEEQRHRLTNLCCELAFAAEGQEMSACAIALFEYLGQAELTLATGWQHTGKWAVRMLERSAPGRYGEALAALRCALDGDTAPLLAVACDCLDRLGGALWSGYRVRSEFPASQPSSPPVPPKQAVQMGR